jgi:hypothetical protein
MHVGTLMFRHADNNHACWFTHVLILQLVFRNADKNHAFWCAWMWDTYSSQSDDKNQSDMTILELSSKHFMMRSTVLSFCSWVKCNFLKPSFSLQILFAPKCLKLSSCILECFRLIKHFGSRDNYKHFVQQRLDILSNEHWIFSIFYCGFKDITYELHWTNKCSESHGLGQENNSGPAGTTQPQLVIPEICKKYLLSISVGLSEGPYFGSPPKLNLLSCKWCLVQTKSTHQLRAD